MFFNSRQPMNTCEAVPRGMERWLKCGTARIKGCRSFKKIDLQNFHPYKIQNNNYNYSLR